MKTSLGERVGGDVDRSLDRDRGTGIWLNRGLYFNHSLRLKGNQKEKLDKILEICSIAKRKENYLNLDILIANLLLKRDRRPVCFSLNTSAWKITRYNRAGKGIINIAKKLYEHDYIVLKKGYKTEEESRMSRIWPTEKLLDCFPKYSTEVIDKPVEVVELRDDDNNLIDYKDTTKTRKIRDVLNLVNKVNQSAEIKYNQYTLHASLVAIFRRKFTLYGRLHTRGYRHYQGLKSDERKDITINNESVVELDFSGLHPHLLYAREGIQLQDDPYNILEDRPVMRRFLKHILLCMLNAKDEISAEKAANHWLYENHTDRIKLWNFGITSARPLIETFRKTHKLIDHYFCHGSDTGLKIMNLDSRIALDVLHHFAKQNIPILAVHDSFIVQEKYKGELRQVMEKTYEKHTNGFKCKIK